MGASARCGSGSDNGELLGDGRIRLRLDLLSVCLGAGRLWVSTDLPRTLIFGDEEVCRVLDVDRCCAERSLWPESLDGREIVLISAWRATANSSFRREKPQSGVEAACLVRSLKPPHFAVPENRHLLAFGNKMARTHDELCPRIQRAAQTHNHKPARKDCP